MNSLLFVSSAMFSVAAYIFYYLDIKKNKIEPNKWSWLIWSVATTVEALTYDAISEDPLKTWLFFISAGCCIVITALIWSKSAWKRPDWTEAVCVIAAFAAIVIWKQFHLATWAHFVTLFALPFAFWPTYRDSWKDFRKEDNLSWMLWTIGDFIAIALVILRLEKAEELPYAIVECACQGTVWLIISHRRKSARP